MPDRNHSIRSDVEPVRGYCAKTYGCCPGNKSALSVAGAIRFFSGLCWIGVPIASDENATRPSEFPTGQPEIQPARCNRCEPTGTRKCRLKPTAQNRSSVDNNPPTFLISPVPPHSRCTDCWKGMPDCNMSGVQSGIERWSSRIATAQLTDAQQKGPANSPAP